MADTRLPIPAFALRASSFALRASSSALRASADKSADKSAWHARPPAALALLAAVVLLGSGCAASRYTRAARRVRSVNPHAALEYVALAQQSQPAHAGAHDVLMDLLQTIPYDHEDTLRRLQAAGDYDRAVAECDRMTVADHLVRSLPGGRYQLFHRPEQRTELARKAATQWYERAREHESGGRMREAALAYDSCLGFQPSFKDAADRRETARSAATVRLWIHSPDARRYPAEAERLVRGTGVEALRPRPRFLSLARTEEQADSVATLTIEQAHLQDTGWQGRQDSRTVHSEWRDPETGRTHRVRHSAVWVVWRRRVRYALSARLSVASDRADHPRPSETFADSLEISGIYATWTGSPQAVPAHIRHLSLRPVPALDDLLLRDRLLDAAAAQFGHVLFLAYK